MRLALIVLLVFALGGSASAEVEFISPNFGSDGSLLFAAQDKLPAGGNVQTLYRADPDSGALEALSAFPERIFLADEGRSLLIENRFGLFSAGIEGGALKAVRGYPSFASESIVSAGKVLTISPSPDGAYLLYAEPVSAASCCLVLLNKATGETMHLADGIASSVENFPARWSPNSRYFIYSKDNSLYYFSIEQFSTKRLLDENLRHIGPGQIAAVRWGSDSSLFYLRGSSLYRILPAEFFTQALYQGLAGMGSLAGKLPFSFDPNFDEFWVDGSGSRLVFRKGGQNLFLIYLSPDDYTGSPRMSALPYLYLEGGTTVRQILWPKDGPVTVFAQSLGDASERKALIYRFDAPYKTDEYGLPQTRPAATSTPDAGAATGLSLSPDGRLIALIEPEAVRILDYARWTVLCTVPAPGTEKALWVDSSRLIVAGSNTIELLDFEKETQESAYTAGLKLKSRNLIALSAVDSYGWTAGGLPVARRGGRSYSLSGTGDAWGWAETPKAETLPLKNTSSDYRVYLETAGAAPFKNIIMLRAARALGTRQLIRQPASTLASLAGPEEQGQQNGFNHGLRTRRREVALSFDCTESSEGLTQALNTLKDYGIRATFYVNGEFIRQNPGAARLLARSGHEVGSMFFGLADLTDARLKADREYIRRGLAKTEDDWYSRTGKELSLLWHSPNYTVNSVILEAGASMNYQYTGRDIDPLDWVAKADRSSMPGAYQSAHSIIETLAAETKPGAIIPIRLGCAPGERDDYLFLELDLLINALEEKGFEIVPVSTLIEHAK